MTRAEFAVGFVATLATAALLGLGGCSHATEQGFVEGEGDAAPFILQHAVSLGARLRTTNNLPILEEPWAYRDGRDGLKVRLSIEDYNDLKALLKLTLGPPNFGPTETFNHGRLGGYRITHQGAGIRFGFDSEGAFVVFIRPFQQRKFAHPPKQ